MSQYQLVVLVLLVALRTSQLQVSARLAGKATTVKLECNSQCTHGKVSQFPQLANHSRAMLSHVNQVSIAHMEFTPFLIRQETMQKLDFGAHQVTSALAQTQFSMT